MKHMVRTFRDGGIRLTPESREEEILQNVAVLLSTPKYSVPLDRDLGTSQRYLDRPAQIARTLLVSEVMDAVERYEPRAEVLRVDCVQTDMPGRLAPVVEVRIRDE